jgi:hypothetical protein
MTRDDDKVRRRGDGEQIRPDGPIAAGIQSFEPVLAASVHLLEGWRAVSHELFEFGRKQLDRNTETGRALAQSVSFSELADTHANYARSAVHDYFTETSKLVDLSARSLIDCVSQLRQAPREDSAIAAR